VDENGKFFSGIGQKNFKTGGKMHHGLRGVWTPLIGICCHKELDLSTPIHHCFTYQDSLFVASFASLLLCP